MSVAASAAMVLAAPASALASLDTTYSSDGVHWNFYNDGYPTVGHAAAIQPDGKIVTAGYINYGDLDYFHVVRYTVSGVLDTTFGGGDGSASWYFSPSRHARATDVAIQPDGKIVVVGYDYVYDDDIPTDTRIFIARLNADGTLDTSFAGDGTAHFDSYWDDYASGVAIDGSGRIIVSGWMKVEYQIKPEFIYGSIGIVVSYNSDGTRDMSFGSLGVEHIWPDGADPESSGIRAVDIGITHANKIVVAVNRAHISSNSCAINGDIILLDSDGTETYATTIYSEYKTCTMADERSYIADIAISGNAFMVSWWDGEDSAFVTRLDADTLTHSWTTTGTTSYRVRGLAVLPDGRFLVGGSTGSGNMELVRYNSNGTLDTSFGTGGSLSIAFSGDTAKLHGLAVHSDGRVTGVGTRGNNHGLATFRLQGEGIAIGKKFEFRSHHGTYLAAFVINGIHLLTANSSIPFAPFTLTTDEGDLEFAHIRFGDVISLQSPYGKYLVAENSGQANANRDSVDDWERWELVNPWNTSDTGPVTCGATIALRSYHDTYLTAEDDGHAMADRTSIGSWERWQVECH